jgi:hypothetical protein
MSSRHATSLALILLSGIAGISPTDAAIVIQTPNVAVLETFAVQPPSSNWSTTTVGNNFGSGSGDIFDDSSADALVGTPATMSGNVDTVFAGDVLQQSTVPVTIQSQSRWYTDGFVGTPPTVNAANLLLATLMNSTGRTLFSLAISYDLGIQNNTVDTVEEAFAGHRVYWSLTGALQSWNPIGDFGYRGSAATPPTTPQSQSFTVPLGSWPTGTNAYVLWVDDNSATNPDALYTIDNVRFTGIPEASSASLILGATGLLGLIRRRRVYSPRSTTQ